MKLSVLSFVPLCFAGAVLADPDERSKQNHKDLYFSNSRRLGQVYHTAYDSKIVGGEPAAPGEFPWFVDWEGCGASLIHPQVILSAAHCDAGISNFFGNTVYVGSFREDSSQNGALRRRLTRRVSHEDYNSRTLAYDFMVGKLDEPIPEDTVPILPLNVDPAMPTDGQDLVVMGHGTTSPGGSVSSLLRKVTVQYVPTGECNAEESYDGSVLGNIMMCAGVDGGNKDSCQGDSGGPIVQCTDDTNSDCSQVGVVSWGIGCGDEDYPGVYSRVSGAVDWIQQKVCELTEGQDNQPDYCNTDGSPSTPNPTPAPTPAANQPTATTSPPVNETPVDGKVLVRFKLRFDGWPSEITWALFQDGVQILQGGPYDTAEAEHTWNLPKGASYRLDVYDSFGDGLCCNYGDGGYDAVIVNGDGTTSELFSSNGQFTEISVKEFTLMDDDVDSSSPPVSTPAPTPTTPPPTPMPTVKPTTAPVPGTPVPTAPTPNQPACEDKPELFFVDLIEENQPCSFLVEQPRFGYLCRFLDVASVCKRTCNVCDYFTSS